MHLRSLLLSSIVTFTLMPGCTPDSKNIGDTLDPGDESSDSAGDETAGHSSQSGDYPSTSDEGTTSTTSTAGESHSTTGDDSSGFTTGTTSNSSDTFGTGDTTDGGHEGFHSFTLSESAGPCPPESDCDGFIMLTWERNLRVEEFGEVGDPVSEAEISEEDFLAAVDVFNDPELLEIIQGPPPMCNPPTDVYENMALNLSGQVFSMSTTGCSLPPVDAAREMAQSLRDKYLP